MLDCTIAINNRPDSSLRFLSEKGHGEHQRTGGCQNAKDFLERVPVLRNVFEHVLGHDEIEGFRRKGKVDKVFMPNQEAAVCPKIPSAGLPFWPQILATDDITENRFCNLE